MNNLCRTLCIVAAAMSAAPVFAAREVNETRPAQTDGQVRISNVAGSVTVQGWDLPEINVSGRLGDGVDELAFRVEGGTADIRVVLPRKLGGSRAGNADLVIRLPKASRVIVEAVSAEITAAEVSGPQRLRSVSGNIELESSASDISVDSVSGHVAIAGSAAGARVDVNSISGDVRATGISGELLISSVSGSVSVADSALRRVKMSSTSGSLDYDGGIAEGGNYEFNNISGNIDLIVPRDAGANYDISTFSGEIRNEFGPAPERTRKYGPGHSLRFTDGGGGAQVSVNTLSGSIRLQEK
jgi:hypothetical protein